jgi:PDZ domain-containing protein
MALGAWNLSLPYYAFSSGPVGNAVDAISVEEVAVYPPGGELLMLTVSGQEVNPYEAIVAAFDPEIDLVPSEAVRPADEDDETFTQRNLASMDTSKETAIAVALERVGYQLELESDGVRVAAVVEDAPAAEVLEIGDLIEAVDGAPIRLSEDLVDRLAEHEIGDVIAIEISRSGSRREVPVELVAHVTDASRPMIGITAEDVNLRLGRPPFPIEIQSGLVGGPSAGMMYALAIIDVLTPGDLTAGHVVAGTGTVDVEGGVGNVGGVRQKVVAAEAAGAEYILIPQGNYEEALTLGPRLVQLIPVSTIDQALDFLGTLRPAAS